MSFDLNLQILHSEIHTVNRYYENDDIWDFQGYPNHQYLIGSLSNANSIELLQESDDSMVPFDEELFNDNCTLDTFYLKYNTDIKLVLNYMENILLEDFKHFHTQEGLVNRYRKLFFLSWLATYQKSYATRILAFKGLNSIIYYLNHLIDGKDFTRTIRINYERLLLKQTTFSELEYIISGLSLFNERKIRLHSYIVTILKAFLLVEGVNFTATKLIFDTVSNDPDSLVKILKITDISYFIKCDFIFYYLNNTDDLSIFAEEIENFYHFKLNENFNNGRIIILLIKILKILPRHSNELRKLIDYVKYKIISMTNNFQSLFFDRENLTELFDLILTRSGSVSKNDLTIIIQYMIVTLFNFPYTSIGRIMDLKTSTLILSSDFLDETNRLMKLFGLELLTQDLLRDAEQYCLLIY